MTPQNAAILFCFFSFIVITFQIMLAFGMPYAHLTMGGKFPGVYSPKLRILAIIQALLLLFIAFVLLSNTNVTVIPFMQNMPELVWFGLTITFISFFLNIITESLYERLLWAPIASILFFTNLIVAFNQ